MTLARAFTKRGKRQDEASSTTADSSFRYPAGTIERSKISLPTEFLSTTNVHALNAPDLPHLSTPSSQVSIRSTDDSDASRSFHSTPATSPATSSANEMSPATLESSQLRAFFATKRSVTTGTFRSSGETTSSSNSDHPPAIPKRALSHSKKAHQELGRQRSNSRLTPPPKIFPDPPIIRNSADMFSDSQSNTDAHHPFSRELAQVHEVAEEFGGSGALIDEEQEMRAKGLIRFDAEEYVREILGLFGDRYGKGQLAQMASPWI